MSCEECNKPGVIYCNKHKFSKNKGCGKIWIGEETKTKYICGKKYNGLIFLCPSCSICPQCDMGVSSCLCSNHSPSSHVTEDKDPDNETEVTELLSKPSDSGSDIPLINKPECKYMLSGVCEHCLAEAVRKLKEDLCGCGCYSEITTNHWQKSKTCGEKGSLCKLCEVRSKKIDKIFGEFK